jgi:hypothetical protein
MINDISLIFFFSCRADIAFQVTAFKSFRLLFFADIYAIFDIALRRHFAIS